MGGRGASSGNTSKSRTINGIPVVENATTYEIWKIGTNAPKGYVGLIKGSGSNAQTAYIKSQYADEFARNLRTGRINVNESVKVLNTQINRTKTKIRDLESGKSTPQTGSVENAIKRNKKLLEAQELVMKLRKDIYK